MAADYSLLIVDDDSDLLDTLIMLFEGEGYAVVGARSLEAASAHLDTSAFHLVLTDLLDRTPSRGMPLTHALQRRAHPIPTGLLSAWRMAPDQSGADNFAFILQKPFDVNELVAQVATVVNAPFPPEKEQHRAVVERFFAALEQLDWQTLRTLCAPDVRYTIEVTATPIQGLDAYIAYAEARMRQYPDQHYSDLVTYALPKGIAARFVSQWMGDGGQREHVAGGVVLRFHDDQIAQVGVEVAPRGNQ